MLLSEMDARLRELVASKMPMKLIAQELGKSYSAIYIYCNNHGIELDQERIANWKGLDA